MWYNRPIAACKLEFQNMHCYGLYSSSNQPRRVNQSASEKNNLISQWVKQYFCRSVVQSLNQQTYRRTDQSRSQANNCKPKSFRRWCDVGHSMPAYDSLEYVDIFCNVGSWLVSGPPLFLFWLGSYVDIAWVLSTFTYAVKAQERYGVIL